MPDDDGLTPRQRKLAELLANLLVADYRAHPPPVEEPVKEPAQPTDNGPVEPPTT